MMRKQLVASIFLGFCLFFLSFNSFADENAAPVPTANTSDHESVSIKLDKIMDMQAQILKQLDEVKAELQVVKIRASQK